MYEYKYQRAGLTSDVIIKHNNKILLIKRKGQLDLDDPAEPGKWALPGGFHEYGEKIEETAIREVMEETGVTIRDVDLHLIGVYSDPYRDGRGHAVSVCYLVELENLESPTAGNDAQEANWFDIHDIPEELAFDHSIMINDALIYLDMKVQYGIEYFGQNEGFYQMWRDKPEYLFEDKKLANKLARELNQGLRESNDNPGDYYKVRKIKD